MSSIMDVAIKRLSDSSCSEYELREYLKTEFDYLPAFESQMASAFKRLKELQLINDLRLATNLAQHYAHKGNRFISNTLEQRGISESIITQVLSALENENVRALDEALKKLGNRWDSSENSTTLLHRFLSGRSFSYAAIKTVIGQLGEQNAA